MDCHGGMRCSGGGYPGCCGNCCGCVSSILGMSHPKGGCALLVRCGGGGEGGCCGHRCGHFLCHLTLRLSCHLHRWCAGGARLMRGWCTAGAQVGCWALWSVSLAGCVKPANSAPLVCNQDTSSRVRVGGVCSAGVESRRFRSHCMSTHPHCQ